MSVLNEQQFNLIKNTVIIPNCVISGMYTHMPCMPKREDKFWGEATTYVTWFNMEHAENTSNNSHIVVCVYPAIA